MNADGSGGHKPGGGGIFQAPAWSPDGKRIAFMRCAREVEGGGDCSTGQIAVMSVNGKGLKLLTKPLRTASADSHPSWSPNGKTIVFERRVSFGNVTVLDGFVDREGAEANSRRRFAGPARAVVLAERQADPVRDRH
jgi:Tol biopolymer transport system component